MKEKGLPVPKSLVLLFLNFYAGKRYILILFKPEYTEDALPNHIYMDAMCFGMGSGCLQVTFQACSIEQARLLYDNLTPITPLMLALSASAPIYRGVLSDVDARWDLIAGSVDDRTKEERGLAVYVNYNFYRYY